MKDEDRQGDKSGSSAGEVTRLLGQLAEGSAAALDQLVPLVYEEMRRLARQRLRRERAGHTLNTTALVHEAYLKLVDQREAKWQNRSHFLAVASTAMRRILVNYARDRGRRKRGSGSLPLTLDPDFLAAPESGVDVAALDQALNRLSSISRRAVRVVECRYFGGLSIEETASALDVSSITVKRDWRLAKSWLCRELG